MASPSCAPPPACVLLPPIADGSTATRAPFSPLLLSLHKNNEKSVQVVAAMVCPKCKISLPPPYLDDSPAGIFNSSYFSLLFLKRSLLDFGCRLGKAREWRLEQGRQVHKRKRRRQEQQDRTPPQENQVSSHQQAWGFHYLTRISCGSGPVALSSCPCIP